MKNISATVKKKNKILSSGRGYSFWLPFFLIAFMIDFKTKPAGGKV